MSLQIRLADVCRYIAAHLSIEQLSVWVNRLRGDSNVQGSDAVQTLG
jgi:hypothetical protein